MNDIADITAPCSARPTSRYRRVLLVGLVSLGLVFLLLIVWSHGQNRQIAHPIFVKSVQQAEALATAEASTLRILAETDFAEELHEICALFYERHPNIRLDIQYTPKIKTHLLLGSDSTNDTPYDIILAHSDQPPKWTGAQLEVFAARSFVYATDSIKYQKDAKNTSTGVQFGLVLRSSPASMVLRDFLLSSPAQDVIIGTGYGSINPTHHLGQALFGQRGDTAHKTNQR